MGFTLTQYHIPIGLPLLAIIFEQGDVGRGTEGFVAVVAIAEILPDLVGVVLHFLGWEEGDEVAVTKCCASSIGGHGVFLCRLEVG